MWKMDYDKAAAYWTEKDQMAEQMDKDKLLARIEAFIEAHNTCTLATAGADIVRCTPIEYNYEEKKFYFFSEGGLKFKGLKNNKNVGLAIYEPYAGFGLLKSLQIQGTAELVEPFTAEYLKLMAFKKIPEDVMRKLPASMNLIKVTPTSYDFLDSDLKKEGFGSRQHLE